MEFTTLTALSPIDGRYLSKVTQLQQLQPIVSEYGLIKYRVFIEIEWFKALANHSSINEVPALSAKALIFLDNLYKSFKNSFLYNKTTFSVNSSTSFFLSFILIKFKICNIICNRNIARHYKIIYLYL